MFLLYCRLFPFDPPRGVTAARQVVNNQIHRRCVLADLSPLKLYLSRLYREGKITVGFAGNPTF